MKNKIFLFVFLLLGINTAYSQQYKVEKEIIHLNIFPSITDTISGFTSINVKSLVDNLDTVYFHLLKMNIDSIKQDEVLLNYHYDDTLLAIALSNSFGQNDTFTIKIYYHGQPVTDPSGWGGFYFSGNVAFNLGVGFYDIPHSYGRVWFPCVDSFAYKSMYEFYITTDSSQMAVCNGVLENVTILGDKKTWHWVLNQPIPSYLASVAVGPYVVYQDTFNGIYGNIPIKIFTTPAYASKVPGSFSNLKEILAIFEEFLGPYMWDRVGYVAVPFLSGAMEHATNIAYPEVCIDGTHNYETLYAHELSHHWFGDLITTVDEKEMWINEGWASFLEAFYLEHLYGYKEYIDYISDKHAKALKDGAYEDGGWYALDNVPQNATYGETSYKKGASVVHTLRYYLGDSLFFGAVKQMLSEHAWETISSEQLKLYLSQYSGIDLTDFFEAWVSTPGYLHFSIDSFKVESNDDGNYLVNLHIRQKLLHKNIYGNNNIVEFVFVDSLLNFEIYRIKFSGETFDTVLLSNIQPFAIITDMYEKTMDASVSSYEFFSTTGTYNFSNCFFTLSVAGTVTDTAFLFVRHNMVGPEVFGELPEGIYLNTLRYWEIVSLFPEDLYYQAKFYFGTTGTYENLDNGFLDCPVDSLVMLYRFDARDDWQLVSSHAVGSQYSGYIILDEPLKTGQYVLAKKNGYSGIFSTSSKENNILIYPVPSTGTVTVKFVDGNSKYSSLVIYDITGKIIKKFKVKSNELHIDIGKVKGALNFVFEKKDGSKLAKRVIIK